MEWILALVVLMGGLGVLYVLVLLFIHSAAVGKRQATHVPEGEIVLIGAGQKDPELKKILCNVEGYRVVGEKIVKIEEGGETKDKGKFAAPLPEPTGWWPPKTLLQRFEVHLWKRFGIRWVSFFFPMVSVIRFTISKDKLQSQSAIDEDVPLKQWVSYNSGEVSSLHWRFVRPTYVPGVELPGDGAQINILVYATYQVVNPVNLVLLYKGKFATHIDASIQSVINNFCQSYMTEVTNTDGVKEKKHLTLETWMQLPKGSKSPLNICFDMMDKNPSKETRDHIEKNEAMYEQLFEDVLSVDLEQKYGLRMDTGYVQAWDPGKSTLDILQGIQNVRLAELDKKAAFQEGRAKKHRRVAPVQGLKDVGVSPDVAAVVSQNQEIAEQNVRKAGAYREGVTIVEGGGSGVAVTLDISTKKR